MAVGEPPRPLTCTGCGVALLPGKAFCHRCGAPAPQRCAGCGAPLAPTFRFCPDCGTPVGVVSPGASERGDRLARHVPPALAAKIRASRGMGDGERKQVTVLFCDLAGSTAIAARLDPEEWHDLLERYLDLAFAEIYRREGIVNQLAGDGLMALFGAPVAHEDAPARAVEAALAIQEAIARLNTEELAGRDLALCPRIGIHTGPVVVGTVGNDLKMDYTALGDTTNLASRLEGLAPPGGILISEATERLVRGLFRLRSRGPVAIRGRAEAVPAFEVLGRGEGASPMAIAAERGLTPFVGRARELAQLEACYRAAVGGHAQAVAVVGEAGRGKSRLLWEFRARLAGEPVTILEARCSALDQSVPYLPLRTMLRRHFGIARGEPAAQACARIAERVRAWDPGLDRVHPHLCRLLALPAEERPEDDAEHLEPETFAAIAQLVLAESERAPVVVIVEDLHWIDTPSRELLESAVAKLAAERVMLVVTHRPDYEGAWRPGGAFTQLRLQPLADAEVTTIIRAVAGGALPAELERRILEKAEGSPFFAEEITRALVEEGLVAAGARDPSGGGDPDSRHRAGGRRGPPRSAGWRRQARRAGGRRARPPVHGEPARGAARRGGHRRPSGAGGARAPRRAPSPELPFARRVSLRRERHAGGGLREPALEAASSAPRAHRADARGCRRAGGGALGARRAPLRSQRRSREGDRDAAARRRRCRARALLRHRGAPLPPGLAARRGGPRRRRRRPPSPLDRRGDARLLARDGDPRAGRARRGAAGRRTRADARARVRGPRGAHRAQPLPRHGAELRRRARARHRDRRHRGGARDRAPHGPRRAGPARLPRARPRLSRRRALCARRAHARLGGGRARASRSRRAAERPLSRLPGRARRRAGPRRCLRPRARPAAGDLRPRRPRREPHGAEPRRRLGGARPLPPGWQRRSARVGRARHRARGDDRRAQHRRHGGGRRPRRGARARGCRAGRALPRAHRPRPSGLGAHRAQPSLRGRRAACGGRSRARRPLPRASPPTHRSAARRRAGGARHGAAAGRARARGHGGRGPCLRRSDRDRRGHRRALSPRRGASRRRLVRRRARRPRRGPASRRPVARALADARPRALPRAGTGAGRRPARKRALTQPRACSSS